MDFRTDSFSAYLDEAPNEDQEIDVFKAEKYFNMDFDDGQTTEIVQSSEESITYRMKKNRASKKQSIFSRFSCKCYSANSESLRVSEPAHVKRIVKTQIAKKNQNKVSSSENPVQEQFEFPILSSWEEPRNSIEAFGSITAKKMTMLTWDAIPKVNKAPITFRTDSGREYEIESCASSDLFEIDNILGACSDMSGRKELVRVKDTDGADSGTIIHRDKFRAEKSGFLLVCKNQRAVGVSESTVKEDQKPMKS